MEISNFVQSALAGINLVGFDASLHGAIVPGDLISGLLASLPYSRWLMFGYTGTGVGFQLLQKNLSLASPIHPGWHLACI